MPGQEPSARPVDDGPINVVDLGHVRQLHDPVGGHLFLGGRVAEPLETTILYLECQQPLIAGGDVRPCFGFDFGR